MNLDEGLPMPQKVDADRNPFSFTILSNWQGTTSKIDASSKSEQFGKLRISRMFAETRDILDIYELRLIINGGINLTADNRVRSLVSFASLG
jgi:hypothetical protein